VTDTAGPPPKREQAASGDRAPVDANQPPPVLSADAYARTTGASPDSTAVIPVVSEPERQHAAEHSAEVSADTGTRPNGVPETAVRLRLVRIDPWSVTRMAFVTAVCLMIVSVVAAAVLWILLAIGGVFGSINDSMGSVLSDDSGSFDVKNYLGFGRMVGGALVLSALNVVFLTALATIAAHLYNLVAAGLGGVEVTLAEE